MGDWWEQAYKGGPMVPVDGFPRPLYPPDVVAQGKKRSPDGPDVVAYKRTICRLGRWGDWNPAAWDDSYSNAFAHGRGPNVKDTGVAGVQRQQGVEPDTGWIGETTFKILRSARVPAGPHAGAMAMDSVAVNLINQAYSRFNKPPANLDSVRAAISDYCKRSIQSEPKIHYQQIRPIGAFGIPPETGFTTDCSGHSTCAYYWAKKTTGIQVPDPNGNGYSGYGYTGTLVNNPKAASPYKVGDLALYGPNLSSTNHVVTCYIAGDASSSRWCSHGSEAAPYPVQLGYRSDLLCVVRPALTP